MTDREMIDAAFQAIGAGSRDDYKIQPTVHAAELASKAPTLAAILKTAQLLVLAEEYEQKDQEAIKAQEAFKSAAARANWAVFLTTLLSALLLVASPMAAVVKIPDRTLLVAWEVSFAVERAPWALPGSRGQASRQLDERARIGRTAAKAVL